MVVTVSLDVPILCANCSRVSPRGGSKTSVTALTPRSRARASKRPQVYAEEAHYCLQWRIANALVPGRSEVIAVLARELPLLAGKEIDLVEVRGDTNVLLLALVAIHFPLVSAICSGEP